MKKTHGNIGTVLKEQIFMLLKFKKGFRRPKRLKAYSEK
jgi:hypothetical protein